ncbi:predicted protein [Lichtheimia corymbifera JMRC:FSU:9682]|uniref:Uncharacterized protein n=1 Tax=Lichtheimia corymbifera JMRC:FSU:9682 TaxID=1263082 RepID=A0A068S2C5_9FUNG|nr:predicted protein [Lichtheimia corymbifera JMRC:FSU:9682]
MVVICFLPWRGSRNETTITMIMTFTAMTITATRFIRKPARSPSSCMRVLDIGVEEIEDCCRVRVRARVITDVEDDDGGKVARKLDEIKHYLFVTHLIGLC